MPREAWGQRSARMKACSVSLVSALVLNVFCLASDYWAVDFYGRRTSIFAYTGNSKLLAPDPVTQSVCPTLAVVSIIVLFCAVSVNILFLHSHYQLVLPAVMTFSFIAAMALLLSLTTWAVPHRAIGYKLSWSFGLAAVVAVLDLASFFLCVVEFVIRRAELLPRYRPQRDEETGSLSAAGEEEEEVEDQESTELHVMTDHGTPGDCQEDSKDNGDSSCDVRGIDSR